MATITPLSSGLQTITATGLITPTAGVDVSGMQDATICIEIVSMTASKTARIQVEGSLNAFTNSAVLAVLDFIGQQGSAASDRRSFRKYELPDGYISISGGRLRLNAKGLEAGATIALNAWIES
jgi:hypothetical protein